MRSAQGHIQKLGRNRYRIFVEGKRDPETGKRTRMTKTVSGTRKEAERERVEMLIRAGEPVDSTLTVREYAEAVYLPAKMQELKKSTYEGYESRLRLHVYPGIGDTRLCELTPTAVRSWLSGIDGQSRRREAYRMLRMLCQFAVYDDHLRENPCARVKPPRKERYEPTVLDVDGIAAYLELFRGSTVEAAVLLAVGCGLRRGEIAALDAGDVDAATGAVTVGASYLSLASGPEMSTPKSRSSYRTVHMPPGLLPRLLEVIPESGPLLVGEDGGRMHPDVITHVYERTLRGLPDGVPRVPLKNLRHTSLTLAYDSGSDLYDVSRRAGHSNMSITSRYYVRPKSSRDEQIARAMSDALGVTTRDARRETETIEVYSDSIVRF